jgi:flagellin
MAMSVNTNVGAMVALQSLNKTNNELETVQSRINTGLRVASAKDDGGIFAIAQNMRGDVQAYNSVTQSLNRLGAVVDVAMAAGTQISDLLVQMKEKALASVDASTDATSRTALNADFVALRNQIASIVTNASFNGTNIINATGSQTALGNTTGAATARITISNENMSLAGTVVTVAAAQDITSIANASTALAAINTSITNVGNALARLGTGSKRLEMHAEFVSKIQDALNKGIGNLVDADMAEESARLQALQVRQQLGIQALSIANGAPGTVLGLFR